MTYKNNKLIYFTLVLIVTLSTVVIAQTSINQSEVYAKAQQSYYDLIKKLNIPIIEIDLDKYNIETLEPKIIIDPNKEVEGAKYYLATTFSMLAHRDTLFIVDTRQNTILVSSFDGKIIKTIGREGSGPGEFRNPYCMIENKSYYFIFDQRNGRIQILNKKFKYVKSLPMSFLPGSRNIAANNSQLLINEKNSVPYEVTSYSLKNLALTKSDFIDKRFTFDLDLQKNNNRLYSMYIDASSDKYIAAVCSLVPYIFIFDNNGKPVYSIKYKSKKITELMQNNKAGSFWRLVNGINIKNNILFVHLHKKMFSFDMQKKSINKVYSLENIDSDTFTIYEKNLFLSFMDKVYRTDINY